MLTNAWYKHLSGVYVSKADNTLRCKDVNGTERDFSKPNSNNISTIFPYNLSTYGITTTYSTSSYGGIAFGDGTVAPSLDDYCLSGNIITTVKSAGLSGQTNFTDDATDLTYVCTVQNTGSQPITITEVCWLWKNTYVFMMDRTLLNTPVTIPAGEYGTIAYTLSITRPSS